MSSNSMLGQGTPGTASIDDLHPNKRQVGGSHYSLSEYQHWDYASDLHMRHLEGACTKYLSRAGNKAGEPRLKDLEKALHYLDKLYFTYREGRMISLSSEQGAMDTAGPTARFIACSMSGHAFTPRIVAVLVVMSSWASTDALDMALSYLQAEIEEERRKPVVKEAFPDIKPIV